MFENNKISLGHSKHVRTSEKRVEMLPLEQELVPSVLICWSSWISSIFVPRKIIISHFSTLSSCFAKSSEPIWSIGCPFLAFNLKKSMWLTRTVSVMLPFGLQVKFSSSFLRISSFKRSGSIGAPRLNKQRKHFNIWIHSFLYIKGMFTNLFMTKKLYCH